MPNPVRLENPIHPVSLTVAQDANLTYIALETFLWKGTWSATPTTYRVYDVVYYNGSSYVNKTGSNTATNPASDTTNWDLMVSKGDQGSSGIISAAYGIENTGSSNNAALRINPTMTTTGGVVSTTNKIAVLDNTGKLQSSILPDLAITSVTTYASTTAMYTDTTRQEGDVGVIASGTGQGSYIRNSGAYSGTSADWTQLAIPPDLVQSVRGSSGTAQTGNVVISASDIGLGNVNNTSDSNKTISGDVTGTLGSSSLQTLSPSPVQATAGVYKTTVDAKGRVLTTASASASDVGALGSTASINIGTTSVPVNRTSASQTLTGISIDGNAGTVTNGFYTTSSFNLGTTSISVNRASGSQSLTGISIDGNAGTVTNGVYINAANTFSAGPQTINIDAASNKGIIIRSASSQVANLQEWHPNNDTATITSASSTASTLTYTATNSFSAGQLVTVTGMSPSGYNVTNAIIASASGSQFTVSSVLNPGASTQGGTAIASTAAIDKSGVVMFAGGSFTDVNAGAFSDALSISPSNKYHYFLTTTGYSRKLIGFNGVTNNIDIGQTGTSAYSGIALKPGSTPSTSSGYHLFQSGPGTEAPSFGPELLTTWTNNGGWNAPPTWVTGTSYVTTAPASVVTNGGNAYVCTVAHTAGTFATDLASGYWTLLGTSASASGATVYQHTAGSATTLTNAYTPSVGVRHILVMTVAGMSTGSFTISYGGNNGTQTYQSNNTYTFGPTTASATGLVVTPSSTFDGTIAFSLKLVSGSSTPSYQIYDSTGISNLEVRTSGVNTQNNLFIGKNSGRYAYSGSTSLATNTGLGSQTLQNLTSGYGNVGINYNALQAVTSSIYNIGIGTSSGNAITTGSYNIAIGGLAMTSNITGSSNVAIGGYAPLQSTTGQNNIGIGTYAGNSLTTGSNNVFVGVQSGYAGQGAVTVSNSIGIGSTVNTSSSNQAVLGNQSITQTKLQGELIVGGGVNGSVVMPYRAITGATTLTYTDYTVDCTSGTFTVTLPLASGATATTTATQATTGSYTIVVASASNITVGSVVTAVGTGLPLGAFVTGASGTTITLNTPTTAAMSATSITFTQQGNASANATVGRIYNIKNSGTGLITVATPTGTTTTATATSGAGQTSLVVASAAGISIGNVVSGTGISPGTRVSNISGTTVTIDIATTASWVSGGSVTFTQSIDGQTSITLPTRYQTLTIQSTGSNWIIL